MLRVFMAAVVLAGACSSSATSDVVADVNGRPITAEEVAKVLGQSLADAEDQVYRMKLQAIDSLVAQRLVTEEATRRGTTTEALLKEEKDARALMAALRAEARVTVHLTAPPIFRAEVGEGTLPPRGPATAPVTVIEFSDFHCPFCRRVQPTLDRLRAEFPTEIRLLYRDSPIDQLHPEARKVSEAARCANDQGRFWEFHDAIYVGPATSADAVLRAAAETAGVGDVSRFEQCVAAGTHRAAVEADVAEAGRLGVNGTPTFYINGRQLRGAQPYEVFERVIREELGRR